jgi:hypothetical protein
VVSATYLGGRMEYVVETDFGELLVSAPIGAPLRAPGEAVGLSINDAVLTQGE